MLAFVQQAEKKPREGILFNEFTNIIEYLNQFLPEEMKIIYIAFDMARCAKEYVAVPHDPPRKHCPVPGSTWCFKTLSFRLDLLSSRTPHHSKSEDVIGQIKQFALTCIQKTGFHHTGPTAVEPYVTTRSILRLVWSCPQCSSPHHAIS
jgi:hypothetical protein